MIKVDRIRGTSNRTISLLKGYYPEVDRIWGITGMYHGSFKDHIFFLLPDGCKHSLEVHSSGHRDGAMHSAAMLKPEWLV